MTTFTFRRHCVWSVRHSLSKWYFPGQGEQVTLSDWLENIQSRIREEINQFIAVGRIPFSVERCCSAQEWHHHSASFSEQGVHCDRRIRTWSYIFWDFAVTQWVAGAWYGHENQDFKCSIMTNCLKPPNRRKKRPRLTRCLVMTLQVILESQSVSRPPSHSCEIWALSDQTNLKRSSVQESSLSGVPLKLNQGRLRKGNHKRSLLPVFLFSDGKPTLGTYLASNWIASLGQD